MNQRVVFRAAGISAAVLALVLVATWANASNMGFKLNYGIVNAVNQLLNGSGVSVQVTDDNAPAKTLVVDLDPANQHLSPANSNMGFKLNLASVPAGGLEVEDPNGVGYLLKWDESTGFSLSSP
jgi:hypothetical protein